MKLLLLLLTAVTFVKAQNVPQCFTACVDQASSSYDGTCTDHNSACFCTPAFQQAVGACILSTCGPADIAAALEQVLCAGGPPPPPVRSPPVYSTRPPVSACGGGYPTASPPVYPPCAVNCAAQASNSSGIYCSSLTSPCACTDGAFQDATLQCWWDKCSITDVLAAVDLAQTFCDDESSRTTCIPPSSSSSYTSSRSSYSSSIASFPAYIASGTNGGFGSYSTPSNAASARAAFGHGGLIAFGVAVAGAAIGGLVF